MCDREAINNTFSYKSARGQSDRFERAYTGTMFNFLMPYVEKGTKKTIWDLVEQNHN